MFTVLRPSEKYHNGQIPCKHMFVFFFIIRTYVCYCKSKFLPENVRYSKNHLIRDNRLSYTVIGTDKKRAADTLTRKITSAAHIPGIVSTAGAASSETLRQTPRHSATGVIIPDFPHSYKIRPGIRFPYPFFQRPPVLSGGSTHKISVPAPHICGRERFPETSVFPVLFLT